VNALIDTHVFLWWINDDPRLAPSTRGLLNERTTVVRFSVVSVWEMAIKAGLGRLRVPADFGGFLARQLAVNRFEVLPILLPHALRVVDLPPHHRDPFDRMLVAQAMVENLSLVSADASFDAYGIQRFW
jgi:PIN domain nuclease of toxin-antitoxin system